MWEQGEVLKDIPNSSLSNRQVDSLARIKQDRAAHCDMTSLGLDDAGYATENGSLAGARWPEQNGHAGRHAEFNVEIKSGNRAGRPNITKGDCPAVCRDCPAQPLLYLHCQHTNSLRDASLLTELHLARRGILVAASLFVV